MYALARDGLICLYPLFADQQIAACLRLRIEPSNGSGKVMLRQILQGLQGDVVLLRRQYEASVKLMVLDTGREI
jgi:hypothetical protein